MAFAGASVYYYSVLCHISYCPQAAQETKHKMGPAADKIYLIHFNDVYNIESGEQVCKWQISLGHILA